MSKTKLKRGDVISAVIKSSDVSGARIYITELEQEFYLPASEITTGDFKKIRKQKLDKIAVRVKTVRPPSFSAKRVDASKLGAKEPEEGEKPVQEPEKKPELKVSVSLAQTDGRIWFMAWWNKLAAAVRYTVKLHIRTTKDGDYKNGKQLPPTTKTQEIAVVQKDRHTAYHTFTDLTKLPYNREDKRYKANSYSYSYYSYAVETKSVYVVTVEAEDREGNIIAKSGYTAAE